MRILFAGSPAIAVPSLAMLSELELEGRGLEIAGVLTNQDSRKGRHGREEPTDVSAAALELDEIRREKGLRPIPQIKPEKLNAEARGNAAALAPDLLLSFACGHFFGPRFLALFPLGGINIHPSLLPKYRGACPIPAAIRAGERRTGICIQKLAAEMDSGDILAEEAIELNGRETTGTLSETVSRRAALMLRELFTGEAPGAIPDAGATVPPEAGMPALAGAAHFFRARAAAARPQEGEPICCRAIRKEEGLIDWQKSAVEIDSQIRAFTPWPLSFTSLGNETLYILDVQPLDAQPLDAQLLDAQLLDAHCVERLSHDGLAGLSRAAPPGTVLGAKKPLGILIQTGGGILAVRALQWQARKALDWKAFCNGARGFIGSRLGPA